MGNRFKKGDLIRWVTGHSVYEAHNEFLVGSTPIYSYGIIMEVSEINPEAIIVNSCVKSCPVTLIILDGAEENIEVLSTGGVKNGK
tara:strand:+ start:3035 stop:3292 length:258 start_codon:yes stop_codon:yes gene_type:complete